MANELFASVKNGFARNSLIKNLLLIVEATKNPDPTKAFVMLDVDKVAKLVAAAPSYVNVAASTDGKTQAVQATAEGIAAAATLTPPVAKTKVAHSPLSFTIEKNVGAPPPIQRGGDRAMIYPFDQLEIGDGFFIPATAENPDVSKAMSGAIATANRRYKDTTPPRKFTIRGNMVGPDGVTKGARVYREALPVKAAPAAPAQAEAAAQLGSPFTPGV